MNDQLSLLTRGEGIKIPGFQIYSLNSAKNSRTGILYRIGTSHKKKMNDRLIILSRGGGISTYKLPGSIIFSSNSEKIV